MLKRFEKTENAFRKTRLWSVFVSFPFRFRWPKKKKKNNKEKKQKKTTKKQQQKKKNAATTVAAFSFVNENETEMKRKRNGNETKTLLKRVFRNAFSGFRNISMLSQCNGKNGFRLNAFFFPKTFFEMF